MNHNFSQIQPELQKSLQNVSHVIIKLGTNTLAPHIEDSSLSFFNQLASQVKILQEQGKKVLIVSSGAVGLGKKLRARSGTDKTHAGRQYSLVEKQALASLGQSLLIDIYRDGFARSGLLPAQILVTLTDFQSKKHYQNLKATLDQLLAWSSVPVINENDAVANYGLKVGDNDTLSALIAAMYPRSLLILLTTIDGFYMQEQKVDVLAEVGEMHMKAAGRPSAGGIGGMRTKLRAGKKILISGQIMNIASGADPAIIEKIVAGEGLGTWFYNGARGQLTEKKRWLLQHNGSHGQIVVDQGARQALVEKGASLLLVGLHSFNGDFKKGDLVELVDEQGERFGKGIISIDSHELARLLPDKSTQRGLELVHRDNFVVTD